MEYKIFEESTFRYIEQIKELLSLELWQNLLLDCSKNELFVLWLLFREHEVNMTRIADYLVIPLNTATGIISRMEKKKLIKRERSIEDKRVVTIRMDEFGQKQLEALMKEFMYYGKKCLTIFSEEEITLIFQLIERFFKVLKEKPEESSKSKVRKITIE